MAIFLRPPPSPRLPDPDPVYRPGYFSEFLKTLRLYFNRVSTVFEELLGANGGAELQNPHAMLMSDEDQANAGTTVANQLSFNQPVILQGIRVENDNEIWFDRPGQYLVTFTLQVSNRGNATEEFEVWAGYDGTNYPLSNTRFDIPARKSTEVWAHIVPAITGIFTVSNPDEDYLTIKWWASSTDVFLENYPEGIDPVRPAIPSVIMTINFVSRLPQTA